jgi:hypothetical protein
VDCEVAENWGVRFLVLQFTVELTADYMQSHSYWALGWKSRRAFQRRARFEESNSSQRRAIRKYFTCLINAGEVKSTQNHLWGNATYPGLRAHRDRFLPMGIRSSRLNSRISCEIL